MTTINIPSVYLPPPFVPKITLNDGSILNARAGVNRVANELWIYPSDSMDFTSATDLFKDKTKTGRILIEYSASESEIAEGYTHLAGIMENSPDQLAIRLKKE